MRILMCPLLLVLSSLAATAQSQSELQTTLLAQSNAAYAALQKADATALKALLSKQFLDVEHTGVGTAADLDQEFASCKTESYELSSPQVRMLTKDSAVLVYGVRQTASCHGHPLPERMLATDTFVREGGTWRIAVHTEVALLKPPPGK